MSIVKVQRATIALGIIALNVYKLPDGAYRLSGRNVTDAVEEPANSLLRMFGVKSLKTFIYNGLSLLQIKAETGESIVVVPPEMAMEYWIEQISKGNKLAKTLIKACSLETLERRADAAFGIQRTEEERNKKLLARLEGKATRRQLTDAIADYLNRHPEISDNHRKWMYSNASDAINLVVFKKRSHRLCADLGVSKEQLRDSFDSNELQLVREVENTSMRMIDRWDIDPLEAIKQCGDRLAIA